MKSLFRPAKIQSSVTELDAEYRKARAIYHQLLDFEDQHQKVLDDTAAEIAPNIVRVGKIVSTLLKRRKRAERSSDKCLNHHPALLPILSKQLVELRKIRDADPRWKEALRWADTPAPDAKPRGKARRKAGETEEHFAERCQKRRDLQSRREAYRNDLYSKLDIYWGTWNQLLRSVDQARESVIKARKDGLHAKWRRPRWSDANTLAQDKGFRIEQGKLWWVIQLRTHAGWVTFRAKCGNWHQIPEDAKIRRVLLTRRWQGFRWKYTVSLNIQGMPGESFTKEGVVALDWGHREHGHPLAREGMRAFTWLGSDGEKGEILLPARVRELLDRAIELKSRVDTIFNARDTGCQSRYQYRQRLMLSGVRTEEEQAWLDWEQRYQFRIDRCHRKVANIRQKTYEAAVRELRRHYAVFLTEKEPGKHHRELDTKEMSRLRKRQNRDVVARYEFLEICKRFGADLLEVPSRNTTRECPHCHTLGENGRELMIACPCCGRVEDKDYRASMVILQRGKEALAKRSGSSRDES